MPQGYNLHFSIKGWEFLHQFLANFSPKKFRFSIAFFRSILYNNQCSPRKGGHCAGVLELVDEVDSKSIASDGVRVRFPPPVPSPWMLASMGIPFLFDLLGANELPLRQGFAAQNACNAPLGAKFFATLILHTLVSHLKDSGHKNRKNRTGKRLPVRFFTSLVEKRPGYAAAPPHTPP